MKSQMTIGKKFTLTAALLLALTVALGIGSLVSKTTHALVELNRKNGDLDAAGAQMPQPAAAFSSVFCWAPLFFRASC